MLLADGFLSFGSVNDIIGAVGFLLTLFSIWFSWWLAKRDIERRIQAAKDQVTDKLSLLFLQTDVAETLNALIQAREACRNSGWVRAIDRCEQAMLRIPKFMPLPGLTTEDREQLGEAVDVLRLLISYIEGIVHPDKKRTELSATKKTDMDRLIALIGGIEGRLRSDAFGRPA